MAHPFQSIPSGKGKYVFIPALVLLLVGQIAFALSDQPLDTNQVHTRCDSFVSALCQGIVGYELAHTVENSRAILNSWDANAKVRAGFSLGIDYVYILGYSNLIALACVWSLGVSRKRKWRESLWSGLTPQGFGANLGALFAWGAWLTALLDSTENVGLLVQLFNGASGTWATLAWACASVKFVLIAVGLLYALYGGAGWLVSKASSS